MLPFTEDELIEAVRDGRVTSRPHPTLPYNIYNYSPEVQYTQKWDKVTLTCRGLILDTDFNVVARPWEKFFNLGQVNLPIQFDDPVEVMDKADGSLGILYPDKPGIVSHSIATRGSFESTQAQKATMMWKLRYNDGDLNALIRSSGWTFLFEIIFPENRIVLDYGDTSDLILLGAVDTDQGYYYGPQAAASCIGWEGPVVEVMPYKTISEALKHTDRKNAEGFVIRSHNFLVKVKQPDYIDLHRLVTNASPKTVWEQLKAGKSKTQIVSQFPDEFHDYIESMIDPLTDQFASRLGEILYDYAAVKDKIEQEVSRTVGREHPITRGDYAREFKKHADVKYFFLLLDDRPVRDVLWSELKPSGTD